MWHRSGIKFSPKTTEIKVFHIDLGCVVLIDWFGLGGALGGRGCKAHRTTSTRMKTLFSVDQANSIIAKNRHCEIEFIGMFKWSEFMCPSYNFMSNYNKHESQPRNRPMSFDTANDSDEVTGVDTEGKWILRAAARRSINRTNRYMDWLPLIRVIVSVSGCLSFYTSPLQKGTSIYASKRLMAHTYSCQTLNLAAAMAALNIGHSPAGKVWQI